MLGRRLRARGASGSRRAVWATAVMGIALLASVGAVGCLVDDTEVPPGMLARVRTTVFGPKDLSAVRSQLGAYAQQRFHGPEGQRQLLEALVDAELMAQEAVRRGAQDDPRVQFAWLEEIAAVHESAELQRRVPREPLSANTEALRAEYARRLDEFTQPQRRSAVGLLFPTFEEAEQALEALRRGERTLRDEPDVLATGLAAREDAKFPAFHPILFDPKLQEGDWLPVPVMVTEDALMAGKVRKIETTKVLPFEDPRVQEILVNALREPLVEEARAAWMEALAKQYPVEPEH